MSSSPLPVSERINFGKISYYFAHLGNELYLLVWQPHQIISREQDHRRIYGCSQTSQLALARWAGRASTSNDIRSKLSSTISCCCSLLTFLDYHDPSSSTRRRHPLNPRCCGRRISGICFSSIAFCYCLQWLHISFPDPTPPILQATFLSAEPFI